MLEWHMIESKPKITDGEVTEQGDPYQKLFNNMSIALESLREAELAFEVAVLKAIKPRLNVSRPGE